MFSSLLAALAVTAAVQAQIQVSFVSLKDVDNVSDLAVTVAIQNTGENILNLLNEPHALHMASRATHKFSIAHEDGSVPIFSGIKVYHFLLF